MNNAKREQVQGAKLALPTDWHALLRLAKELGVWSRSMNREQITAAIRALPAYQES